MESGTKKVFADAAKIIIGTIRAIESNEFNMDELMAKLQADYPEMKKSTTYCVLSELRKKNKIISLPKVDKKVTYRKLGEFAQRPTPDEQVAKVAKQTSNTRLQTILQVARAIIEYPGETFTKKDILKFLRSKDETVKINDATVSDYIGRALVNRNIVETVGRSVGMRGIMVYKKGMGIVGVTEFNPITITAILENKNSKTIQQTASHPSSKPIRFEDLDCTVQQIGESIFAHMKKLEEELAASIHDRADLINTQAEMQGQINSLNDAIAKLQQKITETDEACNSLLDKSAAEKDELISRLLACQKELDANKEEIETLKKEANTPKSERVVLKSLTELGSHVKKNS